MNPFELQTHTGGGWDAPGSQQCRRRRSLQHTSIYRVQHTAEHGIFMLQGRRKGKHTEEFKQLVEGILQQHKFSLLRSAKLSLDDFLRLLACFNEKGIHFAS